MSDEQLIGVAAAVADGTKVDWGAATQHLDNLEDQQVLEGLRLISEVTRSKWVTFPPDERPSANSSDSQGDRATADSYERDTPALEHHWGPLRLIERVGRGTFGDVYRAWDTRLDREVALKILHRHESADENAASTIIQEGRLLARVRHPNIVTVYGAERIRDSVGVWMEFVHGSTLEHELQKTGPFDVDRLIRVGLELGDALAAVHRAGLLHRDIKTNNVMRDLDGRLLLMDFGAGELADGRSSSAVGTPLYVAPEIVAGRKASRQSDIYSLGVVLFRLATGRYPIEGATLDEIRAKHEQGVETSLARLRPDLPTPIVTAIDRAIDRDPARRFGTVDEFCVAFSSLAEQSGILSTSRTVYVAASPRRWWWYTAAAIVVALLAVGVSVLWPRPHAPAIAVLPLKNLGSDPHSSEFADGLTDELTRQLTMIQGLDVRSRTSAFALRYDSANLQEIGHRLRSDYLLTGSVVRADDRVRINVQLVRVSDDATVWTAKLDRNVNDLLNIQDEISRSIINQLQVKLDRLPRRYDIDAATYERYLRARSLSERKDRTSLRSAIAYYKEVIANDATFAPAYAGLADAYADYEFWGVNFEEAYTQVKAAAVKALELDPSLAEAHAAMGLVYARDRQWGEAEREFQHSIQLNPNLSRAHRAYGFWLLYQEGKLDQASKELQLALRSDPLSLDVRRMMAYIEVSSRQYEAAIDNCQRVLKEDPNFPLIPFVLGRAYMFHGESAEALKVLEAIPPNRAPELGYAYATLGRRDEAEALANKASNVPLTQAVIYAGLNEPDRAFAALERAAAIGDPKIGAALTYPELAVLRQDRRFPDLRRRLGLPPL